MDRFNTTPFGKGKRMLHRVEKIEGLYRGFVEVKARNLGRDIIHRENLFTSDTLYLVYDVDAKRIIEAADKELCLDILADLKSDYLHEGFPLSALEVYVSKKITPEELAAIQEKNARLEPLKELYDSRELSPLLGLKTIELT